MGGPQGEDSYQRDLGRGLGSFLGEGQLCERGGLHLHAKVLGSPLRNEILNVEYE